MLAQDIKIITPDLPVVDLARAREFYEGKLGFKPTMMHDSYDVMYQIGEMSGLYLYQREATKADHTEVTFVVDDIEQEMTEMREKGIMFEEYDIPDMGLQTINGMADVGGDKSAWFKDTEGNILSLVQMKNGSV